MSKKIVFITILLIILFFTYISFFRNKTGVLVSPSAIPSPSSEITQPKEMKYDSSTDLKKELDTVNPQVSDSDFE
ncbi:hypothetical protein A3I48_00435 [Candidatus Daviesbacteria bacterium RIFCSPLOWO2_02_FULL_36_7]|uniref:Uncharacterized protein n=1 Tax=Candidatus Daviesbacteria bacterium RIFCSPLOWO2_02_FULL_36_7 TaxID=1797792 RepID=A0A1F5MGD4_9BACT|nr:MAG: hypothetical protein A3I48_00435 [Candidatus Daviesbacteria bacterium RIFCSPLOWO2_02_FULL_36_7]